MIYQGESSIDRSIKCSYLDSSTVISTIATASIPVLKKDTCYPEDKHSRPERGAGAGYLYSFRADTYVYVLVFETRDLLARADVHVYITLCLLTSSCTGIYIRSLSRVCVRIKHQPSWPRSVPVLLTSSSIMCLAYYYCPLNRLTCCSSIIN
jgi:hypothetical protein